MDKLHLPQAKLLYCISELYRNNLIDESDRARLKELVIGRDTTVINAVKQFEEDKDKEALLGSLLSLTLIINSMDIPEELGELEAHEFDVIHNHYLQLLTNGVKLSKDLARSLVDKLKNEKFDAGEYFQLMEDPGEKCFRLQALKPIKANSDVFLIDHFFSFKYRDLRDILVDNETLRKRLHNMTKYFTDRKTLRDCLYRPTKEDEKHLNIDLDGDESITDPRTLDLDWEHIETLSLCNCPIEDADAVAEAMNKCPNLKALWLNGCPVAEGMKQSLMYHYLEEKHPNIQIYNSKFTKHAQEWAVKFATFGLLSQLSDQIAIEDMRECDISSRNFYALKEDHTIFDRMQNVRTLKARDTFFNSFGEANRFIEMIRDMKKLERIELDYYMLDLFWDIKDRIKTLNPTIRYINDYDLGYAKPKELDEEVDHIIYNIWKITHSYKVVQGTQVSTEPIFYVLDEVGSALGHADQPNCHCFPFLFSQNANDQATGKTYSLLYPTHDIAEGDFITINLARGVTPDKKELKLGVWNPADINPYIELYQEHRKEVENKKAQSQALIKKVLNDQKNEGKLASVYKDKPLKVYTDFPVVKTLLTDKRFELTDKIEDADILYIIENLKNYKEAYGDKMKEGLFVNQFPYEGILANKKFLAETIRKHAGEADWLALTYDLDKELSVFVGDYLYRKSYNYPNYWITKPAAMTQSFDMTITNNLDQILRVSETGPKIVCKYVENPLRFMGVKVDFRQYVLVRSFQPLEVYVHKEFLVRGAQNDFTLDKRRLFQNETHFIYNPVKQKMNQLFDYKLLVKAFPDKYKSDWSVVQDKIYDIIREVFALCIHEQPELKSENARALYGIDIIVDDKLNAKLMEVTFSPNLETITGKNKNFINEVLQCLYLGEADNMVRIL